LEKPETKNIKELFIKAKRGIQFHGKTQKKAKNKALRVLQAEGLTKMVELLNLLSYLALSKEYSFITNKSFESNMKMIELERIQVVYDYILKNYQENVSLAEAARLVSMTKTSFCKFLKKHAKKTFSEMVNDIRINHACDLIIQTDKNITTITYESGFNDISYFSRTFKKWMHVTPKSFIAEHRVVDVLD